MNYIKRALQLVGLGFVWLPLVVQAQDKEGIKGFNPAGNKKGYFDKLFGDSNWNLIAPFQNKDLMDIIAIIVQIAFGLAGLVATFYLIYGGYNYITSGGDPEATEGAKVMITNAIIGMVIILVSYLIVEFVLIQLGATNIGLM